MPRYSRRGRDFNPYDPYGLYERTILGAIVGAILGGLGALIANLAAWMFRYRSELSPFAVAGVLVWCGRWTHAHRPSWWPLIAAVTVLAVTVLAVFPKRWRRLSSLPWLARGLERAYIGLCLSVAGGWLAAATAYGPATRPLPVLALAGTFVCAVPWWVHRRRRAKARVARVIEGWPATADSAGLAGTRLVSAIADGWGWTARVALPRGQTAQQVINAVDAIESGLGVRPGAVRAEPDPHRADRAILRVLESDPHAQVIGYQRPAPGTASIHHPVPLGLYDDGSVVRVPLLRRHMLIGGVTDSGKSNVLSVALAYLAECPDVALWGVDLKGGMELAPWAPCLARFATTPAKAVEFLGAAVEEIQLRAAEQVARGERVWEPTEERPALVIVIDEYVELPEQAHVHADTIARLGRAVAVNLLVATQRPTQQAMTNNAVRSQMDVRICLRVRERRDVTLILGEGMLAAGWHAHKLDQPGKFLISAREFGVPRPARSYYISDRDVIQIADQYGIYTPHNPEIPPVGPTPEQNGDTVPRAVAVTERPPSAERLLLDALQDAPDEGTTVPDLMARVGKPRRWVYRRLEQLASTGHVTQVAWGRWRATPPPDETHGE